VSDTFGPKGGPYDLAGWQAMGFDPISSVVDPEIDPASFHAAAAACATYGAYGQ
jgi:hypothetical protein